MKFIGLFICFSLTDVSFLLGNLTASPRAWADAEPKALSQVKPQRVTPFQKTLKSCFSQDIETTHMKNIKHIYDELVQKFALISSVVEYREVLYKDLDVTKKLKYENGQLNLYKISDEDNFQLIPLFNDTRQKSLTTESYLNQLLVKAEIKSDWMRTRELRAKSIQVLLTRMDQELTRLEVNLLGVGKKLICTKKSSSDVCSCLATK